MHIYFSGIGGTAIGPLALIAHQAGYTVSGSDKQKSQYTDYLQENGIKNITFQQDSMTISELHKNHKIDWFVYSSAISIENPNHPEIQFALEHNIHSSKRDELLNKILSDSNQKLVAIAGTHGKTTTTAMLIWLLKQVSLPVSYSIGAKIPFGEMGNFDKSSHYFVYECDEFDRNFLSFHPYLSLITGIDYDHQEIFPTRKDYQDSFKQFLNQSDNKIIWADDQINSKIQIDQSYDVLNQESNEIKQILLAGSVNRLDAWLVVCAVQKLTKKPKTELIKIIEKFPGLTRRFEKITDNLFTDYAHTIPKIKGCLQLASELSSKVVVVYEPLTNRRQHYIKEEYRDLFSNIKKLYWVPSYLAREDPSQSILNPNDLIKKMANPEIAESADLNQDLKQKISSHIKDGDLVVCMSGGGGGSLDEWLRKEFKTRSP